MIKDLLKKDQKNIQLFREQEITFEEFQDRAKSICADFYTLFKEQGFPLKDDDSENYKSAVVLTLHQPLERLEEIYRALKEKTPKQVDAKDLAYMEDKVRVSKGEKQLYGTQYKVENNQITFLPIENKEGVDERRRSVGLEPYTATEERFDTITREAIEKLTCPISTITIIDTQKEWFKSFKGVEVREGQRDISMCGHALLEEMMTIVEDTWEDERFKENPMVINAPFIRFYAGMALHEQKTGLPVGVFCVKDIKPRTFSPQEIATFLELAERAEKEVNIHG